MSEYGIPFHIQEEIMKRLPVKSLIQFRSVSKAWKSLIDSSKFITAHTLYYHTQPHLLVWKENSGEPNFVCYVDDDTFPQQRSLLTIPLPVKQFIIPMVIGSSHGLVCLYESDLNSTGPAVIWNPSISKSIVVDVPKYSSGVTIGFGVCPVTSDPKIVTISQSPDVKNMETNYPCNVMVYTLSSGKWRNLSTNFCTKPLQDCCPIVATGGFIYWRVGLPRHKMVISFDLTNESLEVIDLPDILRCHDLENLYISAVRDSLTMLEYRGDIYSVWMMEHGVEKLFIKLFTINTSYGWIVGFRKNGIPIMQVTDDDLDDDDDRLFKLVVYEPNSEHTNVLEICKAYQFFKMNSYTETLLLLGRSDCSSY